VQREETLHANTSQITGEQRRSRPARSTVLGAGKLGRLITAEEPLRGAVGV
jgi:hypothetical protein